MITRTACDRRRGPEGKALASPTINRGRRRRAKDRLRESAGFTLVELLVAMSMFVIVATAVFAALEAATTTASNETERNEAISEVTTGVARMIAELQRAYKVIAPIKESEGSLSSSYMDVLVRIPETGNVQVVYECGREEEQSGKKTGYDECVRYQMSAAATFTPGVVPSGAGVTALRKVVPRVINETSGDASAAGTDKVFTGLETPSGSGTEPTLGNVTIRTPGKGGLSTGNYKHQVVISNSFYLRQLDYGR